MYVSTKTSTPTSILESTPGISTNIDAETKPSMSSLTNPCTEYKDIWSMGIEELELWVYEIYEVSGIKTANYYLDAQDYTWGSEDRKYTARFYDNGLTKLLIQPYMESYSLNMQLHSLGEPEGILFYLPYTSYHDEIARYNVSFEYPDLGLSITYNGETLLSGEITLHISPELVYHPLFICMEPTKSFEIMLQRDPEFNDEDVERFLFHYQAWPGVGKQIVYTPYEPIE